MLFKSVASEPTLQLSIHSSGRDSCIAYGPGSVINGSILLNSSQPILIQQLSIAFQGQVHQQEKQKQKQQPITLFSITERIELDQQNTGITSDDRTTVVSAGCHMHLFAIQLPLVNYPPTIAETMVPGGLHIDFTLEAFLDRPGSSPLSSDKIRLTYLPLVVSTGNKNHDDAQVATSRRHSFRIQQNSDVSVQIHARMMQSSFCLGEQCNIQLTTDNPTNDKINQIHVAFMTRLSTQHQQHQYINTHQVIPVSVPKQTKNHVSYVSIPIEQRCLPTFDYNHDQLGITLHVDHHIIIGLTPLHHLTTTTETASSSRFFSFGSFYSNASTPSPLYLPVTITTMPARDDKTPSVPLILQHTTNSSPSLQPYFISSKAPSPLPIGTNHDDDDDDDDQYSVSPSSSFKLDDICATTDPISPSHSSQQQHLTVPSPGAISNSNPHQLLSSGSTVIQMGTTQG